MVETKIRKILCNVLNLKEITISNSTRLKDIGFDSLAQVELLIGLEDEFKIQIQEDELTFPNINEIIEFVKERQALSN